MLQSVKMASTFISIRDAQRLFPFVMTGIGHIELLEVTEYNFHSSELP